MSPGGGERYYLRLLLHQGKVSTSSNMCELVMKKRAHDLKDLVDKEGSQSTTRSGKMLFLEGSALILFQ